MNVLYGTVAGLSSARNQLWTQNSPGVRDEAEGQDFFGHSLAGADFDGDGFADLAIGVPLEDLRGGVDAGLVTVLYGTSNGLSAKRQQGWHQDRMDILDRANAGDRFGSALAAGDLNGDGRADLAISVPGEDVSDIANAGAVAVLYGSLSGLTSHGNQLWSQDSPGVLDDAEADDGFGGALAMADFNGDSFDELVVGIPREGLNGSIGAGAVSVLFGSATGLSAAGNQFWTEDNTGTREVPDPGDGFGSSVVGLDFDGDGFADLAAGAPFDKVGHKSGAGDVIVVYGSTSGLTAARGELWNQDRKGIRDAAQSAEFFGSTLAGGSPSN